MARRWRAFSVARADVGTPGLHTVGCTDPGWRGAEVHVLTQKATPLPICTFARQHGESWVRILLCHIHFLLHVVCAVDEGKGKSGVQIAGRCTCFFTPVFPQLELFDTPMFMDSGRPAPTTVFGPHALGSAYTSRVALSVANNCTMVRGRVCITSTCGLACTGRATMRPLAACAVPATPARASPRPQMSSRTSLLLLFLNRFILHGKKEKG